MPTKLNFKLGADPECQMLVGGIKTIPNQIMIEAFKGLHESSESNGYDIAEGNIGFDHNQVLEFRPKAGSIQGLTDNIGGILKTIATRLPYCDLSTLSLHSCIGGHIHLELPDGLVNRDSRNKDFEELHRIISTFYFPIMLSENKPSWKSRLSSGYGEIVNEGSHTNGFRVDSKGERANGNSLYTFEFRTASAEWVTTEKICKSTLSYLAAIYYEYLNHPDNLKKLKPFLWKTHLQAKALRDMILSEHKLVTNLYIDKISEAVRGLTLYEEYKEEIEYILNPNQVYKDKYKADYNPLAGWNVKPKLGIYDAGKIADYDFHYLTSNGEPRKTLFDPLMVKSIIYNNDANVCRFASALAHNVYKAKAKLENNYFLFGIRKGITNPLVGQVIKAEKGPGLILTLTHGDIKTKGDEDITQKLMFKMLEKYTQKTRGDINDNIGNKMVFIGIPFEMRESLEYRKVFEIVAEYEENKTKSIKIGKSKAAKAIDAGNIYMTLTKRQGSANNKGKTQQRENWESMITATQVLMPEGAFRVNSIQGVTMPDILSPEDTLIARAVREEAACAE